MKKTKILVLKTTDPAYNLAAEQYIFDVLSEEHDFIMLWQNDRSVIIGKYQNTLAEINRAFLDENGIKVVRRLSGGGAVYHDLGNLNFTFITHKPEDQPVTMRTFCLPIVDALASIGVKAELNGRNDITVEGKKISGNSQYVRNGKIMHHGTLLFNSDLDTMEKALSVDPDKMEAKGIRSVRSRVTNISRYSSVSPESFVDILQKHFEEEKQAEEYTLSETDTESIRKIAASRYDTWEWNYGRSKECTLLQKGRVEGCGTIEIRICLEGSRIESLSFSGDFLALSELDPLENIFSGREPSEKDYRELLNGIDVSAYIRGLKNEELLRILLS